MEEGQSTEESYPCYFCNVKFEYSYTNRSQLILNNEVQVHRKDNNKSFFILNDLINSIAERNPIRLDSSSLSYFDPELNYYIFCGVFPLSKVYRIDVPGKLLRDDFANSLTFDLVLKIRKTNNKLNLMRMELADETQENLDEQNQHRNINDQSKRSKERKIWYIIEKVFLWRKLYNGFEDSDGKQIKLTLDEAAKKVGISKKSLDDYLIQIRNGKATGFNFDEHKNEKVGALRAFVKKGKINGDCKKIPNEKMGREGDVSVYRN